MHRSFEDDLDKLRTRLIRMGSLVEEQVELSFSAFLDNNAELAKLIRDRDDKVDKLDIKIDKQCQKIFALQQPVAREQMSKLLASGKTELLENFVSNKTRRKFKAFLAYDKKEGKVGFEFEPRAPRVPAKKAAAKKTPA